MTDLEKLVEKRAEKWDEDTGTEPMDAQQCFAAGATDPAIRKAIELRERADVLAEIGLHAANYWGDTTVTYLEVKLKQTKEALAQLMAGIVGEK